MFGVLKPSEEHSRKNMQLVENCLKSAGINTDGCTVAYGSYMQQGIFSKKMHNYAIALSNDKNQLSIVEITTDGAHGEAITMNKADIKSAKKSLQGQTVIKRDGQKDIKISITPYVPTTSEATYMLAVLQEQEYEVLEAFFKSIG